MIKKILIISALIALSSSVFAASKLTQNFFGVKGEILNAILSQAKTVEQDLPATLTRENVGSFKEEMLIEVKNSLAAYGYFKPQISTRIRLNRSQWQIDYFIKPGNVLYINKLDLSVTGEGCIDKAFQALLENFPIHQGNVLRTKDYQQAKSSLVELAAQRGYFAAKLEKSTILVDLEKYQATVILHFDTGPRYYLGEVRFLPSPYSDRFLRRFIPFRPGRPFLNKKINKLQENLSNSNFFQQVTVTPKPEQAKDLIVPVEVELIPRKALQYSLGAGFGTDTGFRGIAGIQLRRVNSSGHHADAVIQASQKMNHLEANYIIPGRNPVTDLYKLSVAAERQHLSTSGKSRNGKIEASHISTLFGWQQTLSLALRDERSEPTDDRPIINSTMLLPNLNWSKIKSDDPLQPNRGYQINFNFRGASKALISNTDFLQALIQGKTLIPISSATRLIAKGQIGYTAISDINQLPISLQFYTGGAQTVRGYQFQEIGPGKTLLMGSLELQQRIKGNLYGAIFVDAGSVGNGFIDNVKKSVGIGVVWRSPIGAIEATLAQALDKPGQPRLLQFSMGPEL